MLQPKIAPAIWGGDALARRFGKAADPLEHVGESWECWDENHVLNGPLQGKSIAQLRELLGAQLLGTIDPARIFPILTKIIDACAPLSVQVHPDDAYAQRVEHQSSGKTECWYVLDAQPGAELVIGWSRPTTREEYERRVADGTLAEILQRVPVQAGEAYYIPAGLLHAIGAGIIIFETQQASDLTYRIFDWNRLGPDGKPRPLHVAKAADVLEYGAGLTKALETITYASSGFQRTALVADAHFLVERIAVTETPAEMPTHDQPIVLMALERGLHLRCSGGEADLAPYQTALIPAAAGGVQIHCTGGISHFMYVAPLPSAEAMQSRLREAGVPQSACERFLAQFHSLS